MRLRSAITTLLGRRGYELSGKTALVTGGSRGLGHVLARQLVAEGARVAVFARDEAELDEVRRELHDVLAVRCDVGNRAAVEGSVELVAAALGPVDVLVNNAGVIEVGPYEEMELADHDEAMRTHFWAPLYMIEAVLPAMRERRAGRIVNIASIGGKVSIPHLLPYSASKFALVGLSQGLRSALLADGILVTTVCPGLMRTGSPVNAIFKGQNREEYAWFSISDALPFTSTSAEHAARVILRACRAGRAELVITPQAKLLALAAGVAPGLVADLMGLVNAVLPAPGGIGTARARGAESESSLSPSWLTALSERAARRNGEVKPS
jgi:short-subunit dehydrogenase